MAQVLEAVLREKSRVSWLKWAEDDTKLTSPLEAAKACMPPPNLDRIFPDDQWVTKAATDETWRRPSMLAKAICWSPEGQPCAISNH